MNVAIIISNFQADKNIKRFLTDLPKNITVHEFDRKCIHLENIDKEINADIFVFATIHQSSSNTPCLTVHPPGNWGETTTGGIAKELNTCPADYFKAFYKKLKEKSPIEITLEATHHGPFLKKSCLFVEIGSSEEQWNDPELGKVMADCIKEVFSKEYVEEPSLFIIGGTHYNHVAIQVMESNFSVGHICTKHNLKNLDKDMIQQGLNRVVPESKKILVDWKGLGNEKQKIIELLDELNITWEKYHIWKKKSK